MARKQVKLFGCLKNKEVIILTWNFLSLIHIFPDELGVLVLQNHALLQTLSNCVEKYLDNCGRRWVNLGTIFPRLSVKPRP
jgi:hypothetical protein